MKRRRSPKLMLLAAAVSLLVGLLFAVMPGHSDQSFRRSVGAVWLVTGIVWVLAWRKTRRRALAA